MLLEVEALRIAFPDLIAVDGVTFTLDQGETLALVGESGSGKSLTALALTRLLPAGAQLSGEIRYRGEAVTAMDARRLRQLRGRQIAYVFQEPTAALNPLFTVGEQIAEALRYHFPGLTRTQVRERVVAALERVGIPALRYHSYPHQLSGGMNQRAVIAMALACEPRLLVADEPTTALDVTLQAEILALLRQLQAQTGLALLLITHNLALVRGLARQVAVMRHGCILEQGASDRVLDAPQHPYTRALLACVPRLGQRRPRLPILEEDI
ncbi:MAG TPA: ABC transporter ATP-binding protein [Candidatus Competibacteraceae bacterium]|nr:ABC transporter ATP-binding protein [Candidatus Competibacteraceae bacterium]